MKRHIFSAILVIPFLICAPGVSLSQGPMMPQPMVFKPGGPPPDDSRTRMWLFDSAVKYLKLDTTAAKRFQPIFMDYSETRAKLMREHFEITRKISCAVDNDSTPVAELQTLARRYKTINRSLWQEKEKFLKRSEEVLDPRQAVKLTIFEDKMKEDLFRKIRKDRSNSSGAPSADPPGPVR